MGKGKTIGYLFWCPGCEGLHAFHTENHGDNPVWKFNGDLNNPTFSPSLGVIGTSKKGYDCHLFLRNGKLQFQKDSKHALAGKTVELPDLPEEWQ